MKTGKLANFANFANFFGDCYESFCFDGLVGGPKRQRVVVRVVSREIKKNLGVYTARLAWKEPKDLNSGELARTQVNFLTTETGETVSKSL